VATKRDQLQSHQFLVQRMISALVTRESDPEQPPFRRPALAAFGSIAVAVLALACVWVYGLIVPGGNKSWQSGNAVVVEKETGTRFVYLDGRLHPVTNYVSALLVLNKNAATRSVSRRSLADVPRGPKVGIPDAPDALPDRGRLLTGGWTSCSEPALDVAGARTSESVLLVGHRPPGGTPLDDAAMLVEVIETGDQYLIARGYRHRIQLADSVAVGLALGSEPWARVGSAFVDVLPAGQPIAPLRIDGVGKPSGILPGRPSTRTGQLFVVRTASGGVQHYVAETNGLRPISALQFDIQRAYAPMKAAHAGQAPWGIELDLLSAGQARRPAPAETSLGAAPAARPRFVAPHDGVGTVCADFEPGEPVPEVFIDPVMPARDPLTVTTSRAAAGTSRADRVIVPPGHAAVVEALQTPQTPAGTVSLVTDLGRSHPFDPALLEVLGYGGVRPVRIPEALVARIPQGSGLTPAAAMKQTAGVS